MAKRIKKVLIPFIIWGILTVRSSTIGAKLTQWDFIGFGIGVIIFIPLLIWMLAEANKGYKETWMTKEFEFKCHRQSIIFRRQKASCKL